MRCHTMPILQCRIRLHPVGWMRMNSNGTTKVNSSHLNFIQTIPFQCIHLIQQYASMKPLPNSFSRRIVHGTHLHFL